MTEIALPPFTGFSPKAFAFLRDLDANQNRAWFEARKSIYEQELKGPLSALIASLGLALSVEGIDLACEPKRALFRIHRDVRFAKDKRPYKAHVSAAMTRDGERLAPGVLYLHFDPKGSFMAAGFWQPEPPALQKIRARMVARPKEIHAIIAGLGKAGLELEAGEPLKRTPRGFEAVEDAALVGLLRMKSLIVRQSIARKTTGDADALIGAIAGFAKQTDPLLRFGWTAIAR